MTELSCIKRSLNTLLRHIISVLGQDKGYTVKYNPLPEEVPKGVVIYPSLRGNIEEFDFSIPYLRMI